MKIMPCLEFDGQCAEAFAFYARLLGGRIEGAATFAALPEPMTELPAHWQDKIANAVVTFGDQSLMGMDPPPGRGHKPQGFMVSLELDSPAETERVYLGLREGGQITMPLNETFWSLSFAMLTDRFGTPWMLTCPRPGFKHPG